MPDALSQALATPGLGWLLAAALVAGTVRGFSGFGTALIYMPVAAQILSPFWAIVTVAVMDVFGPLPNLPRAMRSANRPDLVRMVAGALIALPMGLWVLGRTGPEAFQFVVSVIALVMLAVLLVGVRYNGPIRARIVFGTGALGGFLGGVSGLPGPPVILLYMTSTSPVAVVRANTMLYLFAYDMLLMGLLLAQSALDLQPVLIGLLLAVPNLLGNMLGAALFRPAYEATYRAVAYLLIAGSALSGLPVWG